MWSSIYEGVFARWLMWGDPGAATPGLRHGFLIYSFYFKTGTVRFRFTVVSKTYLPPSLPPLSAAGNLSLCVRCGRAAVGPLSYISGCGKRARLSDTHHETRRSVARRGHI